MAAGALMGKSPVNWRRINISTSIQENPIRRKRKGEFPAIPNSKPLGNREERQEREGKSKTVSRFVFLSAPGVLGVSMAFQSLVKALFIKNGSFVFNGKQLTTKETKGH
jgi:hypothetical protein